MQNTKKDKIVIFTGAGLSASSGISTFRDSGGLWEEYDISEICTAGCLNWNYDKTVEFYNKRRVDLKDKEPNNAHFMCQRLKDKYPQKVEIITQNVDNLLEKAKCKDVLHLHGFLEELRCMSCGSILNIKYDKQDDTNSTCIKCGEKMRPNIVFFGEMAPMYEKMYALLKDCALLVVIGTSGNVIDVNYLSSYANYSILNNLEKSFSIHEENFHKVYYEDANTAFEKIEKDIEYFIENGNLE
ncbi:MAG: NAD-dependent deacetylase [Arcobacter sp.]|nr:NAD-dependent deacetylase [Arcobacter sp.]